MKVLTTLTDNDFYVGVAALINSIVNNGTYLDKIIIGYRGNLPSALPILKETKNGKSFTLGNGLEVELVLWPGNLNMTHEKTEWLEQVTYVLEPDADEYFFCDSDIVITIRMSFFGEWVRQGVALCEDVNGNMSRNHPIRQQWIKLGAAAGLSIYRHVDRYYNGGFIGWTKETKSFLLDWKKCFALLADKGGDMKKFRVHDRSYVVQSANQDSLNLAAMVTTCPISTVGPDAMGFFPGFQLMSHPLGRSKPWRKRFFREFLAGKPPTNADLYFWQNVNGAEIKPMSKKLVTCKIWLIKLLRGLSRFYKSSLYAL